MSSSRWKQWRVANPPDPEGTPANLPHMVWLVLLAAVAVLIHGYHLGADDAAIYVPAIKRVADPGLYPFGAEFFMSHAHLSLFANLVGYSARLSHLPVDFVIFVWHVTSVFLLLLASWRQIGRASCRERV